LVKGTNGSSHNAGMVESTRPVGWRAIGAAVRGVSHERSGTPCQDAQASRVLPGGLVLAVVADGAGSARLSDLGAQTAVLETMLALEAGLYDGLPSTEESWQSLVAEAFSSARQAVLNMAEENNESAREYACTLAAAAVTPTWLVAGQIGDGAVIARDENGDMFAATRLQRGEYANETHFIVESDALEQAVIQAFERPVSGLAVMSDGLIRLALKMPSQEPHLPFFEPLFRFAGSVKDESDAASQLIGFLDSQRVNQRTDDDKALVLAVRSTTERGQE